MANGVNLTTQKRQSGFDMKISELSGFRKTKVGLAAVAAIAVLFGFSSTQSGQRFFAQIGIGETLARTVDAAERITQNGGIAVQAFLARSPGERGAIDILKGKAKRDLAENTNPTGKPKPDQRALGKVFDEPLQSLAGPVAPAPAIQFLPLDSNPAVSALPAALPLSTGGGVFSPAFAGIPVGGGAVGGGGGSNGPGDVASPPAPPPVVAAVPEPSTWILLLLGFAAIGASIRRKQSETGLASQRVGSCATA